MLSFSKVVSAVTSVFGSSERVTVHPCQQPFAPKAHAYSGDSAAKAVVAVTSNSGGKPGRSTAAHGSEHREPPRTAVSASGLINKLKSDRLPGMAGSMLAGMRRLNERRKALGYPVLYQPLPVPAPCVYVSVESTPVDTVVHVRKTWQQSKQARGDRREIKGLSDSARRNLTLKARSVSAQMKVLVTLTYPGEFPTDGQRVKRDLATFRKALRRRCPALGGLWLLEFQGRGAPHFHLFLNGRVDKSWLALTWYRVVGSGDVRHKQAGTRVEAVRKPHALGAYAVKYAAKQEQKEVPTEYRNVGRFWGFFGTLRPDIRQEFIGYADQAVDVLRLIRHVEHAAGYRPRRRRWRGGLHNPRSWSGGVSWGCSIRALK